MIAKVTSGADFGGLTRYLTYKENRVGFTELRNVMSQDVREAAKEIQITSEQSTRCQKPVYHLSVSFAKEDAPTDAQQREAIERVLKELNLESHQAVIISHLDTSHSGSRAASPQDFSLCPRASGSNWIKVEIHPNLGKVPEDGAWYQTVLDSGGLHLKLHRRGLLLSDGHPYAAAGRVSEILPALSRRFGETLQENRIRLTESESRLSHFESHSPKTGRVLFHKAYGGNVTSPQSVDVEPLDPAVRWGEYQVNRALLRAISREHPEDQELARDARQYARYRRPLLSWKSEPLSTTIAVEP